MNERIREILTQCQQESIDGPEYPHWTDFEKFAELIVKECAELCTDQYHLGDAGTGDGFGITAADIRCEKLIKQHFGVEE